MSIRVNGVRYQNSTGANLRDKIMTRYQSAGELEERPRAYSRYNQDSSSHISSRGISPAVPDVSFIKHAKQVSLVPNISQETIKPHYEHEDYADYADYADSSVKTVAFMPSPKFKDCFEKGFDKNFERVREFMYGIGCEEFFDLFHANQISYDDLCFLTKDDLIDMGLPIGPRNRILRALQALSKDSSTPDPQPSKPSTPVLRAKNTSNILKTPPKNKIQEARSPSQYNLRYEVDVFMKELSGLKTNRKQEPSSPTPYSPSPVTATDQESLQKLTLLFKDIAEKQNILMKAIQQNSYAISVITNRATSRRSSPQRGKDTRRGKSPMVSPTKAYC